MKRILIASYVVQAYVSLIGLLLMPVYLHYMGAEATGMVGFFLMLQAFLQLLDLGLSPSLAREMSLFRAGVLDARAARERLRGLEWILGSIALIAVIVLMAARGWIVADWLKIKELAADEVSLSLAAMVIAAAARWLAGLYRSGLTGLEQQVTLNIATVVFATLKFGGVVPMLAWWSAAPQTFFVFQAAAGVTELVALSALLYRALPLCAVSKWPKWSALRGMWPVARAMAFMSAMWIVVMQLDKLILSTILSLDAFGLYTIASSAAGSVMVLVPPMYQVLQPRMTVLSAQDSGEELKQLYCSASQFAAVAFAALSGGMAFFAESALWAWTGDYGVAHEAAPILAWYGLANGLAGMLALPFMLQFAHGYLRLHVIGNIVLGVTLLPALAIAATSYGAVGAGQVLFCANAIFLVFWVPMVYRRLMPDLTWQWLWQEVAPAASATLVALSAFSTLIRTGVEAGRVQAGGGLIVAVFASFFIGLMAGKRTRGAILGLVAGKGRS